MSLQPPPWLLQKASWTRFPQSSNTFHSRENNFWRGKNSSAYFRSWRIVFNLNSQRRVTRISMRLTALMTNWINWQRGRQSSRRTTTTWSTGTMRRTAWKRSPPSRRLCLTVLEFSLLSTRIFPRLQWFWTWRTFPPAPPGRSVLSVSSSSRQRRSPPSAASLGSCVSWRL